MELSDIDLNLLLLFQRLMQERRVSSVAEQMNMSQPGVSNALAKLRRRLGDPLFVRGRRRGADAVRAAPRGTRIARARDAARRAQPRDRFRSAARRAR